MRSHSEGRGSMILWRKCISLTWTLRTLNLNRDEPQSLTINDSIFLCSHISLTHIGLKTATDTSFEFVSNKRIRDTSPKRNTSSSALFVGESSLRQQVSFSFQKKFQSTVALLNKYSHAPTDVVYYYNAISYQRDFEKSLDIFPVDVFDHSLILQLVRSSVVIWATTVKCT